MWDPKQLALCALDREGVMIPSFLSAVAAQSSIKCVSGQHPKPCKILYKL